MAQFYLSVVSAKTLAHLRRELGIERVNLYRYVGPKGELTDYGTKPELTPKMDNPIKVELRQIYHALETRFARLIDLNSVLVATSGGVLSHCFFPELVFDAGGPHRLEVFWTSAKDYQCPAGSEGRLSGA